jgi:A/G-specific adenine glycosylase
MPGSPIISCSEGKVNGARLIAVVRSGSAPWLVKPLLAVECVFSTMNSLPTKLSTESKAPEFRIRLLAWYDQHARDLPWRKSRDPYRVWLSEIMLQQTRVAAVIGHYHEFLRRFPTVQKLAAAREASVLAAWSGLGYYRRARMLHAAAKVVARELGGRFPRTAERLIALPGIGRYTAAAIGSIAFGEAVAVVDGNVERVLHRIAGTRLVGEDLWQTAEQALDPQRPGDFNQAMMELGATVCTPRMPACLTCPLVQLCSTRGELAAVTKASPQTKREIHYALDCREGEVFLVQRKRDARLMAGMWELPELEVSAPQGVEEHVAPPCHPKGRNENRLAESGQPGSNNKKKGRSRTKANGKAAPDTNGRGNQEIEAASFTLRHSITETDYTVRVWQRGTATQVAGEWIALRRLPRVAMTGLARKILRTAGLLS